MFHNNIHLPKHTQRPSHTRIASDKFVVNRTKDFIIRHKTKKKMVKRAFFYDIFNFITWWPLEPYKLKQCVIVIIFSFRHIFVSLWAGCPFNQESGYWEVEDHRLHHHDLPEWEQQRHPVPVNENTKLRKRFLIHSNACGSEVSNLHDT